MPPKSVAEAIMARRKKYWFWTNHPRAVNFRFYPQCETCSSKQGGILSKASEVLRNSRHIQYHLHRDRANTYFHGWKVRPVHALAGSAVAALALSGTEQDVRDGNRARYRRFHQQLDRDLRIAWKRGLKEALRLITP
jgi:hypothetical protein